MRTLLTPLLAWLFWFSPSLPATAAPAPNDAFSNRAVLTGSSTSVNGSSKVASKEPGEPFHAEEEGDTSVWWTWTAPAGGRVALTTEGSSFDTLLVFRLKSPSPEDKPPTACLFRWS